MNDFMTGVVYSQLLVLPVLGVLSAAQGWWLLAVYVGVGWFLACCAWLGRRCW